MIASDGKTYNVIFYSLEMLTVYLLFKATTFCMEKEAYQMLIWRNMSSWVMKSLIVKGNRLKQNCQMLMT